MFFNIKNLFKKKYVYFNIDSNVFTSDKIPVCYNDFYVKTGVSIKIDEIRTKNINGKYHYKNIRANKKTIEKIENSLRSNLINTKNKWSKVYKKDKLSSMASWDFLMFAPFVDDSVPDDKIMVLEPAHKEFIEVTPEMM